MSEVKKQLRRIEDLRSAKYITGTLRDISAIEIKRVRDRFEGNTLFSAELRELYQLILLLGEREGKKVVEKTNAQSLYVAYTTNRHFFGSVNHDIMRTFIKETSSNDRCLIIGDTGKEIWLSGAKKRREVSFVSFAEDSPNPEETNEFLSRTGSYDRVFVYYPGFVSVFVQQPAMLDITFRPVKRTPGADRPEGVLGRVEDLEFLLEPDLAEMVTFFNTQVRYVLFERMLLETQLSRVAARLVKMDTADQHADTLITSERRDLHRAHASFSSRRMIEAVVGYLGWHAQKI